MLLSTEELAKRMLVVLYLLSKGMPGVHINRDEWIAECERLGVRAMSPEEFYEFHAETIREFSKDDTLDAEVIG